ncbi:hypothetical protein N7540_000166 [Penicillium herquei]|nr:hypothetical protein N7540_000166 [Penicillium herquei]
MIGKARFVSSFFNGLPYADEFSVNDQGGQWSRLSNLAGPLLGGLETTQGTFRPQSSAIVTTPSVETLFLARFYDSTLPSFLDAFNCLCPDLIIPVRVSCWGTLLSNDVFDYVSDAAAGRAANLCWASKTWNGPVEYARMFRGCLISVAQTSWYAPGPLFNLLQLEYMYLYATRYYYSVIPCDREIRLDDTYYPFSPEDIPIPTGTPINGFRAAFRAGFLTQPDGEHHVWFDPGQNARVMSSDNEIMPWQGLAATPCVWDDIDEDFDVVATRAIHDILGCVDRGAYVNSPNLYRSHLAWLARQYDKLMVDGRDNLGVGRYSCLFEWQQTMK